MALINKVDEKLDRVLLALDHVSRDLAVQIQKQFDNNISLGEKLDKLEHQVETQNGRVRKLELWRNWITGTMVALGAVVGYIVRMFLDHLSHIQ